LRPWPPRTVVDLRSDGEAASGTHPLASPETRVLNIPLFRPLDPARMADGDTPPPADLATVYRGLLRASARNLVSVVTVVASRAGPVLLHCAAGKDRTGVATALVLAAVGVSEEAIVADYIRTEESLAGLPERLVLGWSEAQSEAALHRLTVERPELMEAPAAAIGAVLDVLLDWPGGALGWLLDHGLTPGAVEGLRQRLTTPG
jgi:protein-tyrosine phosphatase